MFHRFASALAIGPDASPIFSQNSSDRFAVIVRKLRAEWRRLRVRSAYRPERHYMRGPQSAVPRPTRSVFIR
jgi:hypothetical protein